MKKSIREQYNEWGVAGYYSNVGTTYKNPHAAYVIACLDLLWEDKFKSAIDLAAGDGLITKHLTCKHRNLGIYGCDKYMTGLYEAELNKPCLHASFEDIANFKVALIPAEVTIISYAIDLVPKTYVNKLLFALSLVSDFLLIIRPNGHIIADDYWQLEKSCKVGKSRGFIYANKSKLNLF